MFGKVRVESWWKGRETYSFNPRVRGTCLVSQCRDAQGADRDLPEQPFQSPCAGNMFGK